MGPQLNEIDPSFPDGVRRARVRQGPGAPQTHLTLVDNLADMIKWQADGLQVVCLPVTQVSAGQ